MNLYYITGSSRGIGLALSKQLLKNPQNYVYGIARSNTLTHEHFEPIELDLSDTEQLIRFSFPRTGKADKAVLINNAGMLGEVLPVGKRDNRQIAREFAVNMVAPAILMNTFLSEFSDKGIAKQILNISSGAGRHSVEAWSTYCASKAGLDLFSEVVNEEQTMKNNAVPIWSVAPGIVDTSMQDHIRNSNEIDFSLLGKFVAYKEQNMLSTPDKVAQSLLDILANPATYSKVILDIRDF